MSANPKSTLHIKASSSTPGASAPRAADGGKSKKKKKTSKKKKSTAKKSSAANTTAINNLARAEYKKLIAKRQAKLHDEAWLPVGALPLNDNIKSPDFLEQDVEIVHRSLVNNGISMEDITADGFAILLQEARKYALELMTDATDYAVHSHGSENITPADLELAKEMREDVDFMGDNMDALAKVTHETNRRILPPIPDHCYNGVVLPDDEFTLMGRTFDVIPKSSGKETISVPGSGDLNLSDKGGKDAKNMPSYGARRGHKQVQIHLKPSSNEQTNTMDIS
uniref:Uncharacterized protein n=1 Tax=Chaetoceros debilis TaxID=122233 RepID=A0A7S3PZE6_9STRA|mmetsp:Transcript_6746/g.9931  ORF Transcript_6746/g.9931 Transcript_6746/m.9931 type:complete len:281 (-) Transcript_6746:234-1076(-)